MLKSSLLLIFAAFLDYGSAQIIKVSVTTEATTTSAFPESPTQPSHDVPNKYSYSEDNVICVQLIANMTWNVTYDSGAETSMNVSFNLDDDGDVSLSNSSCSTSKTQLGITFKHGDEEVNTQFITFKFKNASGVWNASEVIYTINTNTFPDLNISNHGWYDFKSTKDLFNSNVDVGSSYSCGDVQLMFNSSAIDYKLNATLIIRNLQVQAFFKENTFGKFGPAQDCATSKGTKQILPSAIGATLVIVVLIIIDLLFT